MKFKLITIGTILISSLAFANGDHTKNTESKFLAKTIGTKTLQCTSDAGGLIKISVNQSGTENGVEKGDLRMVAKISSKASIYDSNDEGWGEECGGVFVTSEPTDEQGPLIIIDDKSDDCERGNSGSRLVLNTDSIANLSAEGRMGAIAYNTNQDQPFGEVWMICIFK